MKKLAALTALMTSLSVLLAGCGESKGDPNVGAAPGPPASTLGNQARPGTAGGPALTPPPPKDPMGGRSGAAAGQ